METATTETTVTPTTEGGKQSEQQPTAQTKPDTKEDLRTYSTSELNQMFEDRLRRDREAREKELGMSTKEAKALIKAKKDADLAAKTKEELLQQERDEAKAELGRLKLEGIKRAKVDSLIADKKIKLPEGVSISDVLDMVSGPDEDGITKSVEKLIKFFPFNASMGSGSNPANGAQKTPNIDEQIAQAEANAVKTGNYNLVTQLKLKKQRELFPNM
jgi:hypothetical protein